MSTARRRPALWVLAASLVAASCGPARVPLWSDQWTQYHLGNYWARGVAAGGPHHFEAKRSGYLWRARAFNTTDGTAKVRVEGPGSVREWSLQHDAVEDLEWTISKAGTYSISLPTGVVLGEPRLVRPRRSAPLVVLILADTLRGDHVNETLMPRVMAVFRKGERFTDVTSNAPWTLPSVASFFTSRPVIELTAVDGGLIAIPEGVTSWAEVLQAQGLSGAAFVANFTINVPNGFGKGFDTFEVPTKYGPEGPPEAEKLLAQARPWLRAHRGEPGFLYLHFMDQHEPYHDHEGHMQAMSPISDLASRAREAGPEETRQRRDAYAATVRYLDRELGRFLAELPRQAVVAFTADHGEAFGEHGCWGHGLSLYREALHVPLLVYGPGVPAKVEGRPVQLLDLIPTLLDLAGCRQPSGMVGRTLRQVGSDEPIVAVTFSAGPLRWMWRDGPQEVLVHTSPQPGLAPEAEVKMQEVRPLPTGAFRFDLEHDPGEEHPEPLDDLTALVAARVFATSVGKLVPGLQVLAAGERGPAAVVFRTSTPLRIAQVFSVASTRVDVTGDRFEVRWDDGFPFALAAFTGRTGLRPAPAGGATWHWLEGAAAGRFDAPGSFLWWDQRAALLQRGYEETLSRLRSLGYIQ